MQTEIVQALDRVPIFMDLTPEERGHLANYLRFAFWQGGTVLFKEGETSHDLFILLTGQIAVKKRDQKGILRNIAKIPPYNTLGETAFLSSGMRTATAITVGESSGLIMGLEDMETMSEFAPQLANQLLRKIIHMLAFKLRKTSREYAEILAH